MDDPVELKTTSLTEYRPAAVYVYDTLLSTTESIVPLLSKSHPEPMRCPVEVFVKVTVRGWAPETALAEKFATGAAGAE